MGRSIREDWSQMVSEYERAGLTQSAFASRRRISVVTLRRWIARRQDEGRLSLLPVRVVASAAPVARGASEETGLVEIALPTGVRLSFPVGTDAAYVAGLVLRLSS